MGLTKPECVKCLKKIKKCDGHCKVPLPQCKHCKTTLKRIAVCITWTFSSKDKKYEPCSKTALFLCSKCGKVISFEAFRKIKKLIDMEEACHIR